MIAMICALVIVVAPMREMMRDRIVKLLPVCHWPGEQLFDVI
jgi:hypothetical protein